MDSKEDLLKNAREVLIEAVKLDKNNRLNEAVKAYGNGIEIMLKLMGSVTDVSEREVFRSKIESYMSRAESIRLQGCPIKVQFLEQRKIEEDSKGHSYETIFSKCFDNKLTKVTVEDPYIVAHHQISNFVMFCELLVQKCLNLKDILLFTSEKTIVSALNELKSSLLMYKINLIIELKEFHDREIRFNNGWVVKIGRGLDIYKPIGKYSIGSHSFNYRPCKKTTIDFFKIE